MGLGDNRRSPKMRQRISQTKLKARLARKATKAATERASARGTGTSAAAAKPTKKAK